MSRMEKFEKVWADRHGVPAETLVQYRFESKEGYRLPGMAAHYRTYCDTLDSIVIEFESYVLMPREVGLGVDARVIAAVRDSCSKSIEAAGLRVAP